MNKTTDIKQFLHGCDNFPLKIIDKTIHPFIHLLDYQNLTINLTKKNRFFYNSLINQVNLREIDPPCAHFEDLIGFNLPKNQSKYIKRPRSCEPTLPAATEGNRHQFWGLTQHCELGGPQERRLAGPHEAGGGVPREAESPRKREGDQWGTAVPRGRETESRRRRQEAAAAAAAAAAVRESWCAGECVSLDANLAPAM